MKVHNAPLFRLTVQCDLDCMKTLTMEKHSSRLKSFNPDRRIRARQPGNVMCESLTEYLHAKLRPTETESTTYRAIFNTSKPRCALCKSNTISEFRQLQRSFNDRSPRSIRTAPRSCDTSPKPKKYDSISVGRGCDLKSGCRLPHSLSYCDDYRPGNTKSLDRGNSFVAALLSDCHNHFVLPHESSNGRLQLTGKKDDSSVLMTPIYVNTANHDADAPNWSLILFFLLRTYASDTGASCSHLAYAFIYIILEVPDLHRPKKSRNISTRKIILQSIQTMISTCS